MIRGRVCEVRRPLRNSRNPMCLEHIKPLMRRDPRLLRESERSFLQMVQSHQRIICSIHWMNLIQIASVNQSGSHSCCYKRSEDLIQLPGHGPLLFTDDCFLKLVLLVIPSMRPNLSSRSCTAYSTICSITSSRIRTLQQWRQVTLQRRRLLQSLTP